MKDNGGQVFVIEATDINKGEIVNIAIDILRDAINSVKDIVSKEEGCTDNCIIMIFADDNEYLDVQPSDEDSLFRYNIDLNADEDDYLREATILMIQALVIMEKHNRGRLCFCTYNSNDDEEQVGVSIRGYVTTGRESHNCFSPEADATLEE